MEASFGTDFSAVKVHTDGTANKAAGDINAKAFAQGSNVFFGAGQYEPGKKDGQHLIARTSSRTSSRPEALRIRRFKRRQTR